MSRIIATKPEHVDHALFDPWTVVHTSAGLAAGLLNFELAPSMAAAAAYEIAEYFFQFDPQRLTIERSSYREDVANVMSDLVVFGAGWYLGRRWNGSI